jgi:transglutaminase-like putative cysteine protease
MKRFTLILAALFVCGITLNFHGSASAQRARKKTRPETRQPARSFVAPRERQFEFEYKATLKEIPAGARKVDLWIPVPHDTPFQKITELKIDSPHPYRIHTAQYGNRILHLSLNDPPPSGLTVTMRFNALRREHIQGRLRQAAYPVVAEERDPNMARWLQPDRLVPIDGKVRQWAQEVVDAAGARTDLEKARAIYNHVVSTVKYDKSGQGWGRGDIYYACDARRGNCTDFHAIFIGYSRALGIPARFAIGFPLPSDRGAGQVSGYHCWAEFYAEGIGWVPVDASEAAKDPARREYFFGAHDENRVEFTTGRDLTLNPKQQGIPLNYFIYPYAEADGQPLASVERSFTYRDVPSASTAGGRD